jgi:hypothetical protein
MDQYALSTIGARNSHQRPEDPLTTGRPVAHPEDHTQSPAGSDNDKNQQTQGCWQVNLLKNKAWLDT